MKPFKYIIALIITLAFVSMAYAENEQAARVNSIAAEIHTLKSSLGRIENKIDTGFSEILTKDIRELEVFIRENEQLWMENRDLKNQIVEFGWMKEIGR